MDYNLTSFIDTSQRNQIYPQLFHIFNPSILLSLFQEYDRNYSYEGLMQKPLFEQSFYLGYFSYYSSSLIIYFDIYCNPLNSSADFVFQSVSFKATSSLDSIFSRFFDENGFQLLSLEGFVFSTNFSSGLIQQRTRIFCDFFLTANGWEIEGKPNKFTTIQGSLFGGLTRNGLTLLFAYFFSSSVYTLAIFSSSILPLTFYEQVSFSYWLSFDTSCVFQLFYQSAIDPYPYIYSCNISFKIVQQKQKSYMYDNKRSLYKKISIIFTMKNYLLIPLLHLMFDNLPHRQSLFLPHRRKIEIVSKQKSLFLLHQSL